MTRERTPMVSRRLRAGGSGDERAHDGRLQRYRLVVLATDVGDVVESAGGFLCDRARAGWEVGVHLGGSFDARPLAILGITAVELDADFGAVIRGCSRGAVLAVGAGLLAHDPMVRDEAARIAVQGLTEVTVWGRPEPTEIGSGLDPSAHSLSAAARAFKARALLAAGGDLRGGAPVASKETLFRLRGQPGRRLRSV